MSKSSIDMSALLKALKEFEELARGGRALTQTAGRRRTELRVTLCELTGESKFSKALKRARQLRKGTKSPRRYRSRKDRAFGASETAPGLATPKPFNATHVRQIFSSSIEANRRRH